MALKDFITKGNAQMAGHITVGGYLAGPSNLVIDPAGVGDDTGTVEIKGSLQVNGTTTTVNSATLDVADLNITVAKGAANAGAADGAGLTVDGAGATLTYSSTGDNFAFNKPLDVTGVVTATGGNSTEWNTAYSFGNHASAGYLTSYTVTESDVTTHQAALSITESQISDLGTYLTSYTETDTLDSVTGRGATTTNDISVGTLTAQTVALGDNNSIKIGDGEDFTLHHDGSNNIIRGTNGHHVWVQTDGNIALTKKNAAEYYAIFYADAQVQLRHNNVTKFETTATGIDVTGTVTSDGLTVDGNVGIGETSPLGKLHVKTADSGATADASADEFVIEGSGNTGMSILSGTTSTGSIYFGDSDTNWDGYIAYSHNDRKMTLGVAAGGGSLNIDSSGRVGIGVSGPFADLTVGTSTAFDNGDNYIAAVVQPAISGGDSAGMLFGHYPASGYAKQGIFWERYVGASGSGGCGKLHFVNRNATDTSVPTIADTRMTIDEAGNVGIGYTSPNEKLHVNGYIEASSGFKLAGHPVLTYDGFDGGYATRLGSTGTSTLNATQIFAGGSVQATFKGGNVGIGTTTPDAFLTVDSNVGGSSTGTLARFHSSKGESDSTYLQIAATRHGTPSIQRVQLQAFDNDGSTGRTLVLNPSGGNVGIGLNTPNAGLEIQGPYISQNGFDDDYFKALKLSLPDQTEWGSQVQFSVGRWQNSGNLSMSSLVIALGNGTQNSDSDADTRVMTLTSNGRVVFSPTGTQDGQGVTTYANGANGHYVSCTGTANYWITNHGVASTNGTLSTFYNNGTYCGGIVITSTNVTQYQSASDYRLKENVVPMTGATERLKQLNPVTFDWINSGEASEGFLAHEVGAVVPISTSGTKDEVYDEESAADNPKVNEGDPKYQSVDPAKLVPLLVKTIQELEARITQLET